MPAALTRRRDLLALILAVLVVRLPTLSEPRWFSDEGTFTTVAWLQSHGLRLYADVFDNSPPGIYWIYRGLLAVGGATHHVVVQLALAAAVLGTVVLVYRITLQWFDGRVAVMAALLCGVGLSLPTLDGDLLNVEVAALPFFLGALVLALSDRRGSALAAGMLLAVALVIRPSFAVDGAAVAVALLSSPSRFRRILQGATGATLVAAIVALVLLAQGSFDAYGVRILPAQRAYLVWSNGGGLLPLAFRIAVLGAIAALWFRGARGTRWRLLAIWLPASIAGASLTPRELTHYVIEAVPPVAVALAGLAMGMVRPGRARRPRLWLVSAGSLVALVVCAEVILIAPAQETSLLAGTTAPRPFLHNFSYADLPGYYGRWLAGLGAPHAATDAQGFPGPFATEAAAAQALERIDAPRKERLVVLGDRAWVYFLSQRLTATPYVAMNSAFRLLPDGSADVAATLDAHRAGLVILADAPPGDWLGRLRADGYVQVAAAPWPIFRAPTS
jgi:hypothetical protein